VPADTRREDARLDGGEALGGQAVEADVGRGVAGGPVAVELGLPRRRQHVEAEPEVGLVSEAVRGRRVAIDRELWIESWSEASTWRSEYFRAAVLGVDHAEAAVGRALDEVERADQVPVENLARRLVDERYGKNVEGR
jgi:hypothetical protein